MEGDMGIEQKAITEELVSTSTVAASQKVAINVEIAGLEMTAEQRIAVSLLINELANLVAKAILFDATVPSRMGLMAMVDVGTHINREVNELSA